MEKSRDFVENNAKREEDAERLGKRYILCLHGRKCRLGLKLVPQETGILSRVMTKPDLNLTDLGSSGRIGCREEPSKIGVGVTIEGEIHCRMNDHTLISRSQKISFNSFEGGPMWAARVD